MAPKRDIKQFRQACREAGLNRGERHRAKQDFHREKRAQGSRFHMTYGELRDWLREWQETHGDD